jgi:AcrR family transcriptional regulator
MDALRALLEHKEFTAITTAEIASSAGVTEALIYKYFEDKRDLLHQVLAGYLAEYVEDAEERLSHITGPQAKLKELIRLHIGMYVTNRVFARILLLEVRNVPGYFDSEAYAIVKRYDKLLLSLIREGVRQGSLRQDIAPIVMRQAIQGSIEHVCLPAVVFGGALSPDRLAEDLWALLCDGLRKS